METTAPINEYGALCLCEDACREFIRKVECGEARSRRSYARMKEAVRLLDKARAIKKRG